MLVYVCVHRISNNFLKSHALRPKSQGFLYIVQFFYFFKLQFTETLEILGQEEGIIWYLAG